MSARRVGFGGDGDMPQRRQPEEDAVAMGQAEATAPDAKKMGRFGKVVLSAFLLIWLAGWGLGLVEMAKLTPGFYAGGDWFSFGFGIIWLIFGGAGWIFALVLLLAVVFGRKRDPQKPGAFQRRKQARAAARRADRHPARRD